MRLRGRTGTRVCQSGRTMLCGLWTTAPSACVVVALALFFLFVMASPFLAGFENIIGILIIGVALYEAWKINRHQELVIEGPLKVTNEPMSPSLSLRAFD